MAEKELVAKAIQANKDHQHALQLYTERLQAELNATDMMIAAIDIGADIYDEAGTNGLVSVVGAIKPVSLISQKALLAEGSPLFNDAQWRRQYESFTTVSLAKVKDNDALRDAVRMENIRMHTFDAQARQQSLDISAFPEGHFEQNLKGIDWKRVAVQVNSASGVSMKRTAQECEIRWKGDLHSSVNHRRWSDEEVEKVQKIIAEQPKPLNWTTVSKILGTGRTPIDCMRNGVDRKVHIWNKEADKKLLEAVRLYGLNNWQLVALNVSEHTTGAQCQKRFQDTLDPSIKAGPWSTDEEEKLLRSVTAFTKLEENQPGTLTRKAKSGISWVDVALFLPGRTNNQCREHHERMIRSKKVKTSGKGKEKAIDEGHISEEGVLADDMPVPGLEGAPDDPHPTGTIVTNSLPPGVSAPKGRKRKPKTIQTESLVPATELLSKADASHLSKKARIGRPRKSKVSQNMDIEPGPSVTTDTTSEKAATSQTRTAQSPGSRRSSRLASRP